MPIALRIIVGRRCETSRVAFAVDAGRCASDLGSSLAREPENVAPEGIEPSSVPFRMRFTACRRQSGPSCLVRPRSALANVREPLSPCPQIARGEVRSISGSRVVRADRVREAVGLLTEPAEEGSAPAHRGSAPSPVRAETLAASAVIHSDQSLQGWMFKLLFVGVSAQGLAHTVDSSKCGKGSWRRLRCA